MYNISYNHHNSDPLLIHTYTLYIGLAINCLANITTHDLARDCLSDLVNLMTSHKSPYVRKKAVRH